MTATAHRFHVPSVVRASITPDGLVLLDKRGGMLLASNPIGARIWQLAAEGHTAAEIASRLAAEFDVPVSRARDDAGSFLAALVGRGVLIEE